MKGVLFTGKSLKAEDIFTIKVYEVSRGFGIFKILIDFCRDQIEILIVSLPGSSYKGSYNK